MLLIFVCPWEVIVIFIGIAEMIPLLHGCAQLKASAITRMVWGPGEAKICVFTEFDDV
jgi:hypothetical protein